MARELLPAWQQRGSGHFVFVSSISGFVTTPRASLYAATKFGLRGFALNLREDLRGSGVGVSVITPGGDPRGRDVRRQRAKAPPGLGTGTPQQVASAVVRAIERDKGEISVAPMRQRALAAFRDARPGAGRPRSGGGATRAARRDRAGTGEQEVMATTTQEVPR